MTVANTKSVDLVVPSKSGGFSFADPCTISDDGTGGLRTVRGDARVRFAAGADDYILRCEYVEVPGHRWTVITRTILTAASDPCFDTTFASVEAGIVNVDAGAIAVYDPQTIRSAYESYEQMFPARGRHAVLPPAKPAFFCFTPGFGDGDYSVWCDDLRTARIAVVECVNLPELA